MKKQEPYSNQKIIIIALILFAISIGLMVLYMWKNKFTISETGTLGDGFNGLLAPFISFAGALLVYLSFQAQIKANKLQVDANELLSVQWRFDLHLKILDDIKKDYDKIKVNIQQHEPIGQEAVQMLGGNEWASFVGADKALNELTAVLREFLFLIDKLEKESDENRGYLWQKMFLFYSVKLAPHLPFIRNRIINYKKADSYAGYILLCDEIQTRMFNLREKYTTY